MILVDLQSEKLGAPQTVSMVLFWALVIFGGVALVRYLAGMSASQQADPRLSRSWLSASRGGRSMRTNTSTALIC